MRPALVMVYIFWQSVRHAMHHPTLTAPTPNSTNFSNLGYLAISMDVLQVWVYP